MKEVFFELKLLGVKLPSVKKFKSSIPKLPTRTASSPRKIFGVHLSELEFIPVEDYIIPKFIFTLTSYLKQYSKNEIGLFRKAGSLARQKELRAKLDNGGSIEGSDPNDVASLLKQWLKELPESLIPSYLQDLMIRCQNLKDVENRISAVILCCHLLPIEHLHTLEFLLEFCADIARNSHVNKMDVHNLALLMSPNIFVIGGEFHDEAALLSVMQIHSAIVELLINNVQRMTIMCPISNSAESEAQKSGNELDMSIDELDYSSSVSKKKRSGPVQDLFTGFKKLVAQNAISSSFPSWWCQEKGSQSASRTGSKRKADPEDPLMSPHKKQAMGTISLLVTGNVNSRQLLRRKYKRKRKTKTVSSLQAENPVAALQEKECSQGKPSPLLFEFGINKIMTKSAFTSAFYGPPLCMGLCLWVSGGLQGQGDLKQGEEAVEKCPDNKTKGVEADVDLSANIKSQPSNKLCVEKEKCVS